MPFFDRASHRLTTSLSFRQRLALLFIITLIAVQGLTALFAYGVVRANLVEQGKARLEATTQVFMRQLNVLSERVSDDVEILSLDYALRKAVAENDRSTALSALRNHGNRVGATRMSIVGARRHDHDRHGKRRRAGNRVPLHRPAGFCGRHRSGHGARRARRHDLLDRRRAGSGARSDGVHRRRRARRRRAA